MAAQMAFLAAMVGPKVAAAAAQAALESLAEEDPAIAREAAAGTANGSSEHAGRFRQAPVLVPIRLM